MFYYLAQWTLYPFIRLLWRPKVIGRDHVPRSGPVIVASNHLSYFDSIIVPMMAPRKVHMLAKASYFEGRGLKGRLTRALFMGLAAVPVRRSDGRSAQASLDQALEILQAGNAFGLYPEGTRSPDGRLYKGRVGVAWLALSAGCPVVPVGVTGTQHVQRHDEKWPRHRAPVEIRYGEPLTFEEFAGQARSGRARRAVTDRIMTEIQALSGQETVDTYSPVPLDATSPPA